MIGVLLVNLGSPDSPRPNDVYRYLQEFLLDPYVIDLPYLVRQLLVKALIVPLRYKKSARAYEKIWTEEGAPLICHSKKLAASVQNELGKAFYVVLGMRYGAPSLASGLQELAKHTLERIVVVPLFPQYASATTGSITNAILHTLQIENAVYSTHFYDQPLFIEAWAESAKKYDFSEYDHILFSYHGLPLRHLRKNKTGLCYKAHCQGTTDLLTKRLAIPKEQYSMSFQSRLGPDKWLEPFTLDVIKERAKRGDTKLLVFSPSFVADCLETIFELGIEAKEEFCSLGGKILDLVPSLNSSPTWVQAVAAHVTMLAQK